MKTGKILMTALAVFGVAAAASGGAIDTAVFHADFGGDSVNDVNSYGGGASAGTVDGTATYVNTGLGAGVNSNGRGFSFDGSTGIDYGLGAGSELKIEGSMTYHVRVKFDNFDSGQFMMGRMGPTGGGSQRVNFLSMEYSGGSPAFRNVQGTVSANGTSSFGYTTSGMAADTYYDIFFRFQSNLDTFPEASGFLQTAVYEPGNTTAVAVSSTWWTGTTAQYDASDIMFWVGKRGDYSSTAPVSGVMDQVNVWNRALSITEMNTVIPEPATMGLFGILGGGLLWIRKRFTI